jgi:peptide deformylase
VRIVLYPDPVLFKVATPIEELPSNLDEIRDGMRHVMKLERGVGLAAPQVGLSSRLILVNPTGEPEDEMFLLNPEITRFFGEEEWGEEGCLSFPGIYGQVLRHTHIEVSFSDCDGIEQQLVAEDLYARVLQHEIDHLDGRIFVNRMRPSDKLLNREALEELRRRYEEQAS